MMVMLKEGAKRKSHGIPALTKSTREDLISFIPLRFVRGEG